MQEAGTELLLRSTRIDDDEPLAGERRDDRSIRRCSVKLSQLS